MDFGQTTTQNLFYKNSDSILQEYLKAPYNADGWRFDVGSEISGTGTTSDAILQNIRPYIKQANSNALFLSENISDYNELRNGSLDSSWNYTLFPQFRQWISGSMDQTDFNSNLINSLNLLPRPVALSTYNMFDTHDFSRIGAESVKERI